MAAPAIPERVLVTAESLKLFDQDQKDSPFDIPEEYRLEWHKPVESSVNDNGEVLVVLTGCDLGAGVHSRHQFTLGNGAWATAKEATDALIKRLAERTSWFFTSSDVCTTMITKAHGDTDFLLREVGLHCTLSRLMSTHEGLLVERLASIGSTYSALLHQQCDLEREAIRYQQGLIKDDTDHV